MSKHRVATAAFFGAVTVVVLVVLAKASPDLARAQLTTSPEAFGAFDQVKLRRAATVDFAFMAAYLAFGWALFSLVRDPRHRSRRHPGATAGALLLTGGVLADVVENGYLLAAVDGRAIEQNLDWMLAAGLVKWALLGSAILTLLTLALVRSWRAPLRLGHSTDRPEHLNAKDWDPPEKCTKKKCADGCRCANKAGEPRVGVCLSGGGVRSAAFSLGALQLLRAEGKLDKAKYLTAASGGGYLAAGWALSQTETAPADPPRWAPGSPEERWFRNHSSYLVPDTKGGIAGVSRLLSGLIVNLLLVVVLVAGVSRPVGWAMHGLHPELRGGKPALLARNADVEMAVAPLTRQGTVDTGADKPGITRYAITLVPTDKGDTACFYEPHRATQVDLCVGATQIPEEPGIVEVQEGKAKVVRQPKVVVAAARTPALEGKAEIDTQPEVAVVDELVTGNDVPGPGQFKVARQPLVGVHSGTAAMKYPGYEGWMWGLVGGLVGAALLVSLGATAFRPRGRNGEVTRALGRALGGAALVAFVVIVALPWLVIWLPRALASPGEATAESVAGSAFYDYLLPGGGLAALMLTAARQYMASSKSKDGSGTGDTKPFYKRAWERLSKKKKELKWYETSPMKIAVALGSLVSVVVIFVNSLQFAAANGPNGRLMGLAFIRDLLPWWAFLTDWQELLVIVVGLVVFALAADAHSWSLFPFYKERLSSAFLLRRDGDEATPRRYDALVKLKDLGASGGPQLVACCAVNLNEYGRVPPGRRAASFTFSSTEIGGPLVGYNRPTDYDQLPLSRQRDVTLASAMAISGAAFSPAVGKFNLGPIGTVLALANLRLGVWIPHPCRVRVPEKANSEWDWWRFRRPHWVWFLRELTNKYAFNRRYLYVTDGGHWDNLGLVELLRRGCTEIYCISGAGDGPMSFGTIGEAMALAREELGVEFTLDPSPLRGPTAASSPAPTRELRRRPDDSKVAPFAPASAVKGTFRYTRHPKAAEGVIYYVEADLTADMPFDVHAFAESEPDFPDDPTSDQVFNHRQFESYRALGHHQAAAAVALSKPPKDPTCLDKVKKAARCVGDALDCD
ncbi:MAG TPA: patatin-like phospholipase family protein [Acidimicrobiales bacterium]|nr:patatin-like phospholipase family protein [Acidimicrobiales bacterium]